MLFSALPPRSYFLCQTFPLISVFSPVLVILVLADDLHVLDLPLVHGGADLPRKGENGDGVLVVDRVTFTT